MSILNTKYILQEKKPFKTFKTIKIGKLWSVVLNEKITLNEFS